MRTPIVKIIITVVFGINFASANNSLPPCNFSTKLGYPEKDCRGEKHLSHGRKYVGEFKDWDFDGDGIIYDQNGFIYRSGVWSKGVLVKPVIDNASTYNAVNSHSDLKILDNNVGSNIEASKKKCSDLGFKSGTEGFGKCVLQLSK